jgi:AraC family transcriptional regulator of adaptative response / DNA-3-methyladenine glycosylase II
VDGFEIAVRAVLGQQISVAAASTLAGRLAEAFGVKIGTPFEALTYLFPSAAEVAGQTAKSISGIGLPLSRAQTIFDVAQGVASGSLRLTPGSDPQETIRSLKEIRGIGDWTAQYIAMRALAWPDAFPHTDLALLKSLGETNARKVLAAGEAWRPWRAYAVMHLWTNSAPGDNGPRGNRRGVKKEI